MITMDVGVVDNHRFSNVPPRFRSRSQHARHAGTLARWHEGTGDKVVHFG
ncbi:hypothetical protein [Streptomyces sp. NPDC017529]